MKILKSWFAVLCALVLATASAGASTAQTILIASEKMAKEIPAVVILPEVYAQGDTRCPVVYLLHGAGGNYVSWYRSTNIAQLADQYGALFLAIRHPETFGMASSISGGVDIRPFPHNWELPLRLGEKADHPENWEPCTVINRAKSLKDGTLALSMECGTEDFFLEVNRALDQQLTGDGISHAYSEFPGAHTGAYRAEAIKRQMAIIANEFNKKENRD